MKKSVLLILVAIIGLFVAVSMLLDKKAPVSADRIVISSPIAESEIISPLHISGEANPDWFVEGPILISLTNWDGLIIAEAEALKGGSATEMGLIPFEADMFFEKPEFNNRATLIIQKANPTRDPSKAEAREMTLYFK